MSRQGRRRCICRAVVVAAALLLSVAGARAQQAGPGFTPPGSAAPLQMDWTTFREPTEGAYTVDVPQGWKAAGGVRRFAASEAPTWLTVQSPDGATEIFMGDPAIGTFFLPSQYFPEGSTEAGLHGRVASVMRYRPGAEFAKMYGTRSLAQVCSNVQARDARPLPRLEDEMRGKVQGTRLDAGMETFTCQRNGQPFAAAVRAGTTLVLFPGGNGAGVWGLASLDGFIAPAAKASEAAEVLDHMVGSLKPDPQFEAGVAQASKEEEDRARDQMRQPPAPIPTPYTPTPSYPAPYHPSTTANACPGDLQQRRICNINDGHLVVSGGCLTCIAP